MPVAQPWLKSHTAEFCARPTPSETVVTALGELDAANANELTDYVERFAGSTKHLTLDLSALNFIGTAGFSALHRINVVCSHNNTSWDLLAGPAVRRLLRICDPDGALPATPALKPPAGPARLGETTSKKVLLQLVPQAR
jgi:anti-anti-sigma factor